MIAKGKIYELCIFGTTSFVDANTNSKLNVHLWDQQSSKVKHSIISILVLIKLTKKQQIAQEFIDI